MYLQRLSHFAKELCMEISLDTTTTPWDEQRKESAHTDTAGDGEEGRNLSLNLLFQNPKAEEMRR